MTTMDKAVIEVLNEVGLDGKRINDFLRQRFEDELREMELAAEAEAQEENEMKGVTGY